MARTTLRSPCGIIPAASLFVPLLSLLGSSSLWGQNEHINGKWRSPFPMRDSITHTDPGEIAVHLMLLRGSADSTHALYWTHGYSSRLMLNATAGSSAPHVNVPSGGPTDPDYVESFCGGHSTLAQGTAFIGGGTHNLSADPVGTIYSATFDAANYGSPAFG